MSDVVTVTIVEEEEHESEVNRQQDIDLPPTSVVLTDLFPLEDVGFEILR